MRANKDMTYDSPATCDRSDSIRAQLHHRAPGAHAEHGLVPPTIRRCYACRLADRSSHLCAIRVDLETYSRADAAGDGIGARELCGTLWRRFATLARCGLLSDAKAAPSGVRQRA